MMTVNRIARRIIDRALNHNGAIIWTIINRANRITQTDTYVYLRIGCVKT
jgi:hypothetical protein